MRTPSERVEIIEGSLTCFAYGWCSFLPVIGLALFVLALLRFQKVRLLTAGEWNPAIRYLNWGMILASIGGFISAVLFAALVFSVFAAIV